MKKSLFITVATALIFASCAQVDTLKNDIQNGGNEEGEAIGFTSYTQKLTRAENSTANYDWTFFNHHETFKVWAFKNPNTSYDSPIFVDSNSGTGVVIDATRTGSSAPYTYSFGYAVAAEARYWDKSATTVYNFYAAAPAAGSTETNGGWTLVTTGVDSYANQDKAYFTTTSTLSGVNLRAATTDASKITSLAEATSSFKNTADIDKLIAAPQSGSYPNYYDAVSNKHVVPLHFNHILSKMNVTVKKDAILESKQVRLLKIEFFNLKNKGNFNEGLAAATTAGSLLRWQNQAKAQVSSNDVVYSYISTDGDDADDDPDGVLLSKEANEKIYFIESLVIPQATEVEAVDYDGTVTPAVYYTDYTEYNTANSASLTEEQYNQLPDAQKIKTAAVKVSGTSKPYFVITYLIDDELFQSYHNVAASFKVADANVTTFDFLEGYQNTLNINIKPEEIEFTADVADWAESTNNEEVDI